MLVSVLAAGSRARIPLHGIVPCFTQVQPSAIGIPALRRGSACSKYSDRDGRGVNPAAALSRRHALDTMASRLVIKLFDAMALDLQAGWANQPVLSAELVGKLLVG